jgi:hypothetical protein
MAELTREQDYALFGFFLHPDAYKPITDALDPLVQDVEARLSFGHREKAIADTLAAKWGPKDSWRLADDPERDTDRRAASALYEKTSGETLFRLDHTAYKHRQDVEALVARAVEPPDAVTAWARRAGTSPDSIPAAEALSLTILDELRQARFDRELSSLQPSQVLAAYQHALDDPLEPGHASMIRYVEGRHAQGWHGPIVTKQEAEAMTSAALLRTIKAVRAARMPETAQKALNLIARAEALVNKATSEGRIRSQRPDGWRVA